MRDGEPLNRPGREGRSRWLPMEGCVNFRDLGGYRNDRGQTVRWRRLFRSDALQEMTPADSALAFDELGVRLVVDLRNSDEAKRDGRGPLPGMGAAYRHFPFLEGRGIPPFTGGDVAERLSVTYQWLINNSGSLVADAVNAIGEAVSFSTTERRQTVVFHCSAGKDRTGVVAALILEVLGVDSETITADYLLTNEVVDGIVRRIKRMENNASPTAKTLAAQPAAFQSFQDTLQVEYGGAEAYLLRHGVSGEALDALKRDLLE